MDLVNLADKTIVGLGKLREIVSAGGDIVAKAHATIDDAFPKIITILQTVDTVLADAGPVVEKLKPIAFAMAPLVAMFAPKPAPAPAPAKPAGAQ